MYGLDMTGTFVNSTLKLVGINPNQLKTKFTQDLLKHWPLCSFTMWNCTEDKSFEMEEAFSSIMLQQ